MQSPLALGIRRVDLSDDPIINKFVGMGFREAAGTLFLPVPQPVGCLYRSVHVMLTIKGVVPIAYSTTVVSCPAWRHS